MITPIDFGKLFLNNWFYEKDAAACADMLPEDSLFVMPDRVEHFISREKAREWLQERLEKSASRKYVDVAVMKSNPCGEDAVAVSYEASLIPADARDTTGIRCSMVVRGREDDARICFVHMSDNTGDTRSLSAKVRDLLGSVKTGAMLLECREDSFALLYANDFFTEKLKYSREDFETMAGHNPFFYVQQGEDRKFARTLKECTEEGRDISVRTVLTGAYGQRVTCQVSGVVRSGQEGDGKGKICFMLFQDVSGYQTIIEQFDSQLHLRQELLKSLPGCSVVLQRGDQETKLIYMSPETADMFGMTAAALGEEMKKDPLYGLDMTDITRKRVEEEYLEARAEDPDCGMFRIERPDGTSLWAELFISSRERGREAGTVYLFYLDRDRQKRELDKQMEASEMISRIRREQAREDIETARKKAEVLVEEEKEKTRKFIESSKEELDRRTEVRVRNAEQREAELRNEYKTYKADTARKLALMEKALREARQQVKEKEKEFEDTLAAREQVFEKKISALEEKLAQGREEQSHRRQELETGLIRAAQRARMKEKADAVRAASLEELELVPGLSPKDAETVRENIAADYDRMTEIEPDSLSAGSFLIQDAVRNIMLYQSPRCTKRGIGLIMQAGKNYPREVRGDRPRLQSALSSLLDYAVDNTPEEGRVVLTYTSDWPSRGRVNMRFRLRFDARAFSEGELQDPGRVRGNPVREGLLVALEDIRRMGGSLQITEASRESSEITVWVSMAVPERTDDMADKRKNKR